MKNQLALLLLSVGISQAAPTVFVDQYPPTYPLAVFGSPSSTPSDVEFATRFVIPPGVSISGAQISHNLNISGTYLPGQISFNLYQHDPSNHPGTQIASEPNTLSYSGSTADVTGSVGTPSPLGSGTYWAAIKILVPSSMTFNVVSTGSTYVAAPMNLRISPGNWQAAGGGFPGFSIALKIAGLAADPYPAEGSTMESYPGVTFKTLYPPAINDRINLTFRATTSGSGVTLANNQAIFLHKLLNQVVVRKGDAAPGTTGTFTSFGDPVINSNSDVAFMASLRLNPTVTGSNNQALWTDLGTPPLRAAWREGNPAVGLPGRTFRSVIWMHLSDDALYLAARTSGTATPTTLSGVWLYSGTTLTKVVAQQDSIVLSGSTRTVKTISTPYGAQNGRAQSRVASPGGNLILQINTTDGHSEYVPFAPAP